MRAIDATNAILHATHATNAILHVISYCLTIETPPHQYLLYIYNLPSKRVFTLCIKLHHQAEILWLWFLRGNGEDGQKVCGERACVIILMGKMHVIISLVDISER
jgi:hypothetical protein